MLMLEIEFLTGVCFTAESPSSERPDWPPQPDRIFSALVAAWGSRGERKEEREALEWLERQPTPLVEASAADHRRVGTVFVPPNDAVRGGEAMPDRRRRQPRTFPAAIPERPAMRVLWEATPPMATLEHLDAIARDAAYVGHSASMVRCRFVTESVSSDGLKRYKAERGVYAGRVAELTRDHAAGRRPGPGIASGEELALTETAESRSIFGSEWIIWEDIGGNCPDFRGISVAAKQLRNALMARIGNPIPEYLSGHSTDGSPLTRPHAAVIGLADVGFNEHSGGRLMGLALILPRALEEDRKKTAREWLEGTGGVEDPQRWLALREAIDGMERLNFGGRGEWEISRVEESRKHSLRAQRYTACARQWATATPIVLDRFPKEKNPEARAKEIDDIIRASCANIGLPEPAWVRPAKHSAIQGAPAAYPSGKAPAWTGWTLAGPLQNRVLTHAVIEFAQPVRGPVILGAGRFVGLGLCLPMGDGKP